MMKRNILINWTGVNCIAPAPVISLQRRIITLKISFLWPGRTSPSPSPVVSPSGNLEHKDYLQHQHHHLQPAGRRWDASLWLLPCWYHCLLKLVVLLWKSFVPTDSNSLLIPSQYAIEQTFSVLLFHRNFFLDFQFIIRTLPSCWPCLELFFIETIKSSNEDDDNDNSC